MKKEDSKKTWKLGLRLGLVQVEKLSLIPEEYKFAGKLMTAREFLDCMGFPKYESNYDFLTLTDLNLLTEEEVLELTMKVKGYAAKTEYVAIIVNYEKDLRTILSDLNGRMTMVKI